MPALPSPALSRDAPREGGLPTLLLTCGDPAGIGPEVVLAAWRDPAVHAVAKLRVVAADGVLTGIDETVVAPDDDRSSAPRLLLRIRTEGPQTESPEEPPARPTPRFQRGLASAEGGRIAAEAVERAARLALAGSADAIVTGPLNKAALHAAGYDVPGHTELLARVCGLPDDAASMMLHLPPGPELASPGGLSVVHATLHESLRYAVGRLSAELVVAAGRRLGDVLERLLGRPGRIAVAALNPHGGEAGLFGDEEPRIVMPAVRLLAGEGLDVAGPLPADTLFLRCREGEFDGVVALYHDQGHIPVKLLGMHRAVNVTLGLPLVRTSVAHGTAYDIVGTGRADPSSMISAIHTAAKLASTTDVSGAANARSSRSSR